MLHRKPPLVQAAMKGDLPGVLAALISDGGGRDYDQALRVGAEKGHAAVFRFLLDAGADVHTKDDYGLRYAARYGHLAVVQCLLSAGANVQANGAEALLLAVEYGHPAVVNCLINASVYEQEIKTAALHEAALNGHIGVVELLCQGGAILNPMTLPGLPPASQVIISASGDINGYSATSLARSGVCPEAICILLERQGHEPLAAIIKATQMLDPLEPGARAKLLEDLWVNIRQPMRSSTPNT